MEIHINDNDSPERRDHLLKILPLMYALKRFGFNKRKVAEWLCISYRTVTNRVRKSPELKELIRQKNNPIIYDPVSDLTLEERCVFNDKIEEVKSRPGYVCAEDEERKIILKRQKHFIISNLLKQR